jgi:periplasmic divalent cation tolerance protein
MTDKMLVMTTAGTEAEAGRIARTLVEHRLAACVNIVPRVRSVYRWQEKVETSEEFLLLVKTVRAREEELRAAIRELHSYELPEHIGIGIDSGSEEYLRWVEESVS